MCENINRFLVTGRATSGGWKDVTVLGRVKHRVPFKHTMQMEITMLDELNRGATNSGSSRL